MFGGGFHISIALVIFAKAKVSLQQIYYSKKTSPQPRKR